MRTPAKCSLAWPDHSRSTPTAGATQGPQQDAQDLRVHPRPISRTAAPWIASVFRSCRARLASRRGKTSVWVLMPISAAICKKSRPSWAGVVHDAAHLAFAVDEAVRERRDVAHMDAAEGDDSPFLGGFERGRERFRRRARTGLRRRLRRWALCRPSGPFCSEFFG